MMFLNQCKRSRGIYLVSIAIILNLLFVEPVISMPCPLSQEFIQYVDQCPRNSLEWNARSAEYNCSSVNQTCIQNDMFVYHCVLNSNGTMLMEVCAPLKYIHGQKCAEFNSRGNIVQENSCNCSKAIVPCPKVYRSTDAFKYQSCYDEAKKKKVEVVPIKATMTPKFEINGIQTNTLTTFVTINVIGLIISLFIILAVNFAVCKIRKGFKKSNSRHVAEEICELKA